MTDELQDRVDWLTRNNSFTAGALWLAKKLADACCVDPVILSNMLDVLHIEADKHATTAAQKEIAKLASPQVQQGIERDIVMAEDVPARAAISSRWNVGTRSQPERKSCATDARSAGVRSGRARSLPPSLSRTTVFCTQTLLQHLDD